MVVVCGSSTTWIMDKFINSHGGLYNRVTYEMNLSPFTLGECDDFFVSRNIKFTRYDIACIYMILGGIPYYLSYFKRGVGLPQNIDYLFFPEGQNLSLNMTDCLLPSSINRK